MTWLFFALYIFAGAFLSHILIVHSAKPTHVIILQRTADTGCKGWYIRMAGLKQIIYTPLISEALRFTDDEAADAFMLKHDLLKSVKPVTMLVKAISYDLP